MCICSVFFKYSVSVEEKLTESNKDTIATVTPTVLFPIIRANEYRCIVKKCYFAGITFE